MNFSEAPP